MNFLTGSTEAGNDSLAEAFTQSWMPVAHWAIPWQENKTPDYKQMPGAMNMFLKRSEPKAIRR